MFPNPQDALPLPHRPDLQQYKKQAKDLAKACQSGDAKAIRSWAAQWTSALVRLADLTITPELPVRIDRWVDQLEEFACRQLMDPGNSQCVLADAQYVIARSHGFESWPRFAKHLEALAHADSSVTKFELAADAVVSGDVPTLKRLLRDQPELIRARSAREHRATLLHYVSANGVEGYRQKTPKNAVQVAEILLKHGAEVEAEADVYGGGATTLELVATSAHPERMGLQEELIQLLLDHGAEINRPGVAGNRQSIVVGCLANGRSKAAEFLARRGAALDLEAASGLGLLDVVQTFFNEDGSLKRIATKVQMERGFLWACEFGRNATVEFLLQKGVNVHTQANTGQTGLHWAVIGGHMDIIKVLLDRGAPLEAKNDYGGTALGQALWSAVNGDNGIDYARIIEALLDAGAQVEEGSLAWLAQQPGGSSSVKQRIADVLQRHGAKT